METNALLHLYPTLEMLGEALTLAGIPCRVRSGGEERRYQGARMYAPGMTLSPEVIYVLRPGEAEGFPARRYACAGAVPEGWTGACLACPRTPPEAVLDALLVAFMGCRALESRVDELVFRSGSLEALCGLAAELLGNPICIHDDWFVMVARSEELPKVLKPDYIMSSSREFIPRIIVEDFKNDTEYLETYAYRTARLWDASPDAPKCLYVNLWEGSVYRGRLLVVQFHRDFRRLDYALAEIVAQRALHLLSRKQLGADHPHRSMDDIVYDLLRDGKPEAWEEKRLLELLGWNREDTLVCIRIESQQQGAGTVMEHALHSDLFLVFPEAYILFAGSQQCVLLNVTRNPSSSGMLSHRLAPACRDYCLYAGISSPVAGIREAHIAWLQAGAALEKAFRLRSERWTIPFSDCALEYLAAQVQPPMRLGHLVSPELLRLIEHDAAHGTPYFETLRTYLLQERDIPRTSQALIIHRTTLLYRLKRIEAIVGLNLNDPWTRLQLTLSLWILEQEGKR